MDLIYRRGRLLTPETIKTLFLGTSAGNTYVIGRFAEELKVLSPWTDRYPSLLQQAIALQSDLSAWKEIKGRTALWNSILKASDLFGDPVPGDSILLFTDGGDNRSIHFRDEVQRLLVQRGIRLFLIEPLDFYSLKGDQDIDDGQHDPSRQSDRRVCRIYEHQFGFGF